MDLQYRFLFGQILSLILIALVKPALVVWYKNNAFLISPLYRICYLGVLSLFSHFDAQST